MDSGTETDTNLFVPDAREEPLVVVLYRGHGGALLGLSPCLLALRRELSRPSVVWRELLGSLERASYVHVVGDCAWQRQLRDMYVNLNGGRGCATGRTGGKGDDMNDRQRTERAVITLSHWGNVPHLIHRESMACGENRGRGHSHQCGHDGPGKLEKGTGKVGGGGGEGGKISHRRSNKALRTGQQRLRRMAEANVPGRPNCRTLRSTQNGLSVQHEEGTAVLDDAATVAYAQLRPDG